LSGEEKHVEDGDVKSNEPLVVAESENPSL
jgi:hypothetical protein